MMPAFQRGDILFLTNYNDPIRVGEIVVFKIKDREIPIVHRVLRVHEREDGEVKPPLSSSFSIFSSSDISLFRLKSSQREIIIV